MRKISAVFAAVAASIVSLGSSAKAAPIIPGDLVIYRVGDGTAALSSAAAGVFLDEYTTSGSLVQSIALPNTGGSAFTAVGNATTEGIISRSQDGNSLIFTGYQKAAGGTSPASDTYLVTPRTIALVGTAGTVSTVSMTNDNGATSANTIRSATGVDSSSPFWVSTSTRISYYSGVGTGTTQIDARNSREVNLSGNTLYASNGSTTITGKVQSYGTLPTTATAATPVVSLALTDAVNGFVLLDTNPSIPGDDTIYALSTVESLLRKYSFDGTNWVAEGSIASTASNLAGAVNGSSATLFLTTGTTLSTITDTSGPLAALNGTISPLATASTNTAFRGIGLFAAVPEPASLGLVAMALPLLATRRRRTK